MRPLDLTGNKFGRWTALTRVGKAWRCACECGKVALVKTCNLRSGASKSCGCIRVELVVKRLTTHGQSGRHSGTRLYRVWSSMISRTCNPNNSCFRHYGGRGIDVFSGWRNFETFAEWAGQSGYKDTLEIDRIDNGRGYTPQNCRWVTHKENCNNRRRPTYEHVKHKPRSNLGRWV